MATSPKRPLIAFLTIAVLILLAIIFIRVALLMLSGRTSIRRYQDPPVAQQVVRGTVYDRNGRILAIETPYWGVFFHLNRITDLRLVAEATAPYLGMNPDQIIQQASGYSIYAKIKEPIDAEHAAALQEALVRQRLTNQVSVEKKYGRSYPAGFHAAQIIGFVNSEGEGIEGLELRWEHELNPYPELGVALTTYGQQIVLTLDMDIQYALDLQLQQIADSRTPEYAMGIVMDARNGDLLALSSWPWFDINHLSYSSEQERKNTTVNLLFEPGSVFKLFSIAAILKAGEADLDTPFLCDGSYTFYTGGRAVTINCSSAHGTVGLKEMIQKSCNGAIAHWALQTKDESFMQTLRDLGFTQSWDIGLPSRARSIVADPSRWSGRSKPTIAFGQELLTTALHLVTAATALGSDGALLAPHLILQRRDTSSGELLYQRERTVVANILDIDQAQLIREGMSMAAQEGGTGTRAQVEGVAVGIKTGTAQLLNPETLSYEDGTLLASSLALVPVDQPRYIIYIGAGDPKGSDSWGANIAAPAIAEVIKALISQGKLITTSK
jgi:cell division protein FtsI (penicillin-binding protein 3)